jgi:hypothetical protein
MSGSFYTPASFAGLSPSAAFRTGFTGSQEIERNAQALDEADQMMKLRQIQNERAAQLFPIQLSAAEQALKRNAQMTPLEIERARLGLQQLREDIGARNTAAAGIADYLRGGGSQPSAPAAPAVPAGATPWLYTPPASAPAAAPAAAPTAVPGPQSSILDRYPGSYQLASAGVSDWNGLPTGMPEPDFTVYPDTGYPTTEAGPSPTAPGALPAALLPPNERYGVAPPPVVPAVPPAPAYMTDPYAGIPVGTVPRPEPRPISESPALIRAFLERSQMIRETDAQRNAVPAAPPQPGQLPQSRLDFTPSGGMFPDFTPEEVAPPRTTGTTAGVTPQGERTPTQVSEDINRRITELTREAPTPLSVLSPVQIGNEQRALDAQAASLERQRRLAMSIARSNPTAAMSMAVQIEAQSQAIALNRANLNGRRAIADFAAGNPDALARDFYTASGGVLRLEQRPDGNYNIWGREGETNPRASNIKPEELITQGRLMYDNNYRTQVDEIRKRQVERSGEVFKAFVTGLEEALKNQSIATRDIAVKRAEAAAKAAYPNMDVRVDATSGTVVIADRNNIVPPRALRPVQARDMNGRVIPDRFIYQEVEVEQQR